jgi:phosphate uptake regulator
MRRTLVKQGHNTLTVSLPRRWCDGNGLKGGEEIDIVEKGACLLLSKEAFKGQGSVVVDATGLTRSTIIMLIESLYTYGYDNIEITTKDTKARYCYKDQECSIPSVVHYAVNRLLGAEVVSSSATHYTIQVLTETSRETFDVVLRRIFRLLPEMVDAFIDGARKKDEAMRDIVVLKYNDIKKFVNYALRILNKFGHDDADKTTFYFAIINYLGKISEAVKNLVDNTLDAGPIGKRAVELCQMVQRSVVAYQTSFYKYDPKQLTKLQLDRDEFKKAVRQGFTKMTPIDVHVLTGFSALYDILLDLSELRMAIGHG